MTYGELLQQLYELNPVQLNQDVTVFVGEDEYLPVETVGVAVDDDVLDKDHLVLVVAGSGPARLQLRSK